MVACGEGECENWGSDRQRGEAGVQVQKHGDQG